MEKGPELWLWLRFKDYPEHPSSLPIISAAQDIDVEAKDVLVLGNGGIKYPELVLEVQAGELVDDHLEREQPADILQVQGRLWQLEKQQQPSGAAICITLGILTAGEEGEKEGRTSHLLGDSTSSPLLE